MARDLRASLNNARPFAIVETNRTRIDSINSRNPIDLWRFTGRAGSQLTLKLDSLTRRSDLSVAVLNSSGRVLRQSRKRGPQETLSGVALEAGATYFVRVQRQSGSPNARYRLSMAATSIAPGTPIAPTPSPSQGPIPSPSPRPNPSPSPGLTPSPTPTPIPAPAPAPGASPSPSPSPGTDFGNTFEQASQLPTSNNGSGSVTNFVGNSDPNDYLVFAPLISGRLNLELIGNANLEVYDRNRALLFTGRANGTNNRTINEQLRGITGDAFFIRVSQVPGTNSNYTLNYSYQPTIQSLVPDRLGFIEINQGTGATAQVGSRVGIEYTVRTLDGKLIDTSRGLNPANNQEIPPFNFTVGSNPPGAIQGVDQGIRGMRVGGRRQLLIDPSLAYGANAIRDPNTQEVLLPANSFLIFDVELVSVS